MNSAFSVAESLDLTVDTVELTRQLCDIASVSGNEQHLADRIEATLQGFPHLQVFRYGNTVVARTELQRERRVIIAGHIDTVPVNENLPTKLIDRAGEEYLWGRGTVDMKGGVAVQLKLAAEISAPQLDVTWVFYDNEEVAAEFNGLGLLAQAHPELLEGNFAILCEPTNAQLEGGCNGNLRFQVSTAGVRAHSARAWMGSNAIHKLGGILDILNRYQPATVPVDGLEYREGLNAVAIDGGVAGNVIPDAASVTVNYRFAPDKTAAEAAVLMTELFAGYDFAMLDQVDGARPGLDNALAEEFVAALGVTVMPKYGWTDVARFWALGIPAVNFGPGDPSKAHADDEALRVADLAACEQGLRNWLSL